MLAWYLVYTKPRHEQLALENLVRQNYECYLPYFKQEKIRKGRLVVTHEPLFPRYVFIQLDNDMFARSWAPIRSTLGVSQLIRFGDEPAVIEDQIIAQLRSREQIQSVTHVFEAGDRVLVQDGPLAGLEGVFQMTDSQQRCMVLLNLLHRQTIVRLSPAGLKKIS